LTAPMPRLLSPAAAPRPRLRVRRRSCGC
jgi:hypothetical protein